MLYIKLRNRTACVWVNEVKILFHLGGSKQGYFGNIKSERERGGGRERGREREKKDIEREVERKLLGNGKEAGNRTVVRVDKQMFF